jgi:GGDEF domain-containing protein
VNLTLANRELFEHSELACADPLIDAARSLSAHAADDSTAGELIIVVRPESDHDVLSGGTTGVLRAAVSVAVAAGDTRIWDTAPAGDTTEVTTRTMPDVVVTAAMAAGVHSAHVGRVEHDGADAAIAIWFPSDGSVAPVDDRQLVLATLAEAAARAAAIAAAAAEAAANEPAPIAPVGREFDADDPDLDPATGLFTTEKFLDVVETVSCNEASVIIIDVGATPTDASARRLADQLVDAFDRHDVFGRLGADQFAVLSPDAERSATVNRARGLLSSLTVSSDEDPEPATATTIALAHDVGMIDIEDMLDAAGEAADRGRRSGRGGLVLAA